MTQDDFLTALLVILPFATAAGIVAAGVIAVLVLRAYHRAVVTSMGAAGSTLIDPSATPAASGRSVDVARGEISIEMLGGDARAPEAGERGGLYTAASRAPWRAGLVCMAAGSAYALVITSGRLITQDFEFFPIRFLLLFTLYSWPTVIALGTVSVSTRRGRFVLLASYFLGLAVLAQAGLARSPDLTWSQIAILWLFTNGPATAMLLVALRRRVRAVSPLILMPVLLSVLAFSVFLALVMSSPSFGRAVLRHAVSLGMGFEGTLLAAGLASLLVVGGLAGWGLTRWTAAGYVRKRHSDQTIYLDSVWMLFAVNQSLAIATGAPAGLLAGVAAYGAYRFVSARGFSVAFPNSRLERRGPRLLLLRVFSLGKRSERLYDLLGLHWRYVGSIQLIAGPDLATTTVEPHEFLDFVSGRLRGRFIDGPRALESRIAEMDATPDPDGRFRVHDFFCYVDAWKMVLGRLAKDSDAVLMDLRGFTRRHAGCLYEISELINEVPLGRVLMLTDTKTDEPFLRESVARFASEMRVTSPNLRGSAALRLYHYRGARDLPRLLREVCAMADSARVAGTEAFPSPATAAALPG